MDERDRVKESANWGSPPPFRRTVVIRSSGHNSEASVADNVHEFAVRIRHNGDRVVEVTATAARFPWTTCPRGIGMLKALEGRRLMERVSQTIDQSEQCTHMLDLAKLAIAHASDECEITYSVSIDAFNHPTECSASIVRNGNTLFTWHVAGNTILSPAPFAGHVTSGRAQWSECIERNPPLREAALILRRSLIVFVGRRLATTAVRTAAALGYTPSACLSFQPTHITHAVRPAGFVDFVSLDNHSD